MDIQWLVGKIVQKKLNQAKGKVFLANKIISDSPKLALVSVRPETARKIVYIEEFDKHDIEGSLLCRNIDCKNYPRSPYRKYCSKKCNKDFRRWYYHNFYWERVRSDIFKRDNYTCQICNRSYPYRYHRRFVRSKKLDCDHIIPRSLYEQNGYKFDTLENKIKATIEFFHNHDNLRTLCHDCHKRVTSKYLSIKLILPRTM